MQNDWHVIGHARQIEYLGRIAQEKKLSHAFLFTGPAQIGRSLVATRFAQLLLCEQNSTGSFCGQCKACHMMQKTAHPDFFLLSSEEEGTIKIESIRDLQNFLHLRPYRSHYKICLIKDADEMTIQAQNALLKILEEPPEYAILLLIARDQSRMLETIASRCRELQFFQVRSEDLDAYFDSQNVEPETRDLLRLFFGGKIGGALSTLQDPALIEQLEQKIDTYLALLGGQKSERLALAHAEPVKDLSRLQDILDDMEKVWALILDFHLGLVSPDQYLSQQIKNILLTSKTLELNQIKDFLTFLEQLHGQLKAGLNYQLQWERLLLRMPRLLPK